MFRGLGKTKKDLLVIKFNMSYEVCTDIEKVEKGVLKNLLFFEKYRIHITAILAKKIEKIFILLLFRPINHGKYIGGNFSYLLFAAVISDFPNSYLR